MSKICCVTGHRDIPINKIEYVKDELRKQVILAIQYDYTHFISGFAGGSDLYFANIVAELREEYPNIILEAAIPYRKRLETKDKDFQKLIKLCNDVHVCTEKFHKGCYLVRNMYMANKSERVIAVYDGREGGGTAFTMLYTQTIKKELIVVNIKDI